jgi:hypothetical protein
VANAEGELRILTMRLDKKTKDALFLYNEALRELDDKWRTLRQLTVESSLLGLNSELVWEASRVLEELIVEARADDRA